MTSPYQYNFKCSQTLVVQVASSGQEPFAKLAQEVVLLAVTHSTA
jgi:hypothetical protein